MNPIAEAAHRVVKGDLRVAVEPWFCLKTTRQIVEDGLNWPSREFYRRYWRERVEENVTNEPWARDLERSMRNLGMAVHQPQAGDLVFRYDLAEPYGHVAVMLTDQLVLENTPTHRGYAGPNALRIVHIEEWGTPTTTIRIEVDDA